MSRHGYTDDYGAEDPWSLIRWRGAVAAATKGARGQAFLREMLATLEAMPEHRLIENEFVANGEVCALGTVAKARGIDLSDIDPDDEDARNPVADRLGIAPALAAEIMYWNDEGGSWRRETPEQRWERMRRWVAWQIR